MQRVSPILTPYLNLRVFHKWCHVIKENYYPSPPISRFFARVLSLITKLCRHKIIHTFSFKTVVTLHIDEPFDRLKHFFYFSTKKPISKDLKKDFRGPTVAISDTFLYFSF